MKLCSIPFCAIIVSRNMIFYCGSNDSCLNLTILMSLCSASQADNRKHNFKLVEHKHIPKIITKKTLFSLEKRNLFQENTDKIIFLDSYVIKL